MEMQAEAERRKRALILDSQGEQQAEVNLAEGKKQAAVLASEATMQQRINLGRGEAVAIEAHAAASAKAVRMVAEAMSTRGGHDASRLRVAEQCAPRPSRPGPHTCPPRPPRPPAAPRADALPAAGTSRLSRTSPALDRPWWSRPTRATWAA